MNSKVIKPIPDEVRFATIMEPAWPISQMFVAERSSPNGYARPLNDRRVRYLMDDWDEQAIGTILLSMRNSGQAAIIDGRHRAYVASQKGRTTLPAYVYLDLSVEDEARLYRRFGETLSQTARDRYLAGLVEGDELTLSINAILTDLGMHVTGGGQEPYGIQAVNALVFVTKLPNGFDVLSNSLLTLRDAFGPEPTAYVGKIIQGTAAFLLRYGNDPVFHRRYGQFVRKLAEQNVTGLIAKSNTYKLGGDKSGNAVGKSLLQIFNSGRGEKLGEWKDRLYSPEQKRKMTTRLREVADPKLRARQQARRNGR